MLLDSYTQLSHFSTLPEKSVIEHDSLAGGITARMGLEQEESVTLVGHQDGVAIDVKLSSQFGTRHLKLE